MTDQKQPYEVMAALMQALSEKIEGLEKAEILSKPPVSEAQRRAMGAAAGGNLTLDIPKKVGKEFIDADKGGKLPAKKTQKKEMSEESSEESSAEASKDMVKTELCKKCGQMHMAGGGGCMAKEEKPMNSGVKVGQVMDSGVKPKIAPKKLTGLDKPIKTHDYQPLKVEKSEYQLHEVADELRKVVVAKIDAMKVELQKMEKREAEGKALEKGIGNIPSETPSNMQVADGDAVRSNIPVPKTVFELMRKTITVELRGDMPYAKDAKAPEAGEEVSGDEGSGGDVKKDKKLSKVAMSANVQTPKAPKVEGLKPSGVPGAKTAPTATKPPQAPGAAPSMHKDEMDTSIPPPIVKAETMTKAAMHPSPVFKVRLGGKDPGSKLMTTHALQAAPQPGAAPMPAPAAKMPSVEEHAARHADLAAFTPKGKF